MDKPCSYFSTTFNSTISYIKATNQAITDINNHISNFPINLLPKL